MNTWVQDNIIPIYITLSYKGDYMGKNMPNLLKFPINPESLEIDRPSEAETVEIEGLGEVAIPSSPKLAKLTIKSFFWTTNPDAIELPAKLYVNWLEKWQRSKKPATLVVTRLNYIMPVICEDFKHWTNAGEEKDVYFELALQEYRPYGAKKLGVVKNKNLLDKLKISQSLKDKASKIIDKATPIVSKVQEALEIPVLVELPRPPRIGSGKQSVKNPYTVKLNETLMSITKKITGKTEEWRLLYEENKKDLGDVFTQEQKIKIGTKLMIPSKWLGESSHNVISEG